MNFKSTMAMDEIRKTRFTHSDDKLPNGTLLINFGKYKHTLTFSQLYEQQSNYCKWVTKNFTK